MMGKKKVSSTDVMQAMNLPVNNDLYIGSSTGTAVGQLNGGVVGGSAVSSGSYSYGSCDTTPWVTPGISCWGYWQDYYYPYVIAPSYPVYVQERAVDKGKKAYEIIKMLKDKKLVEIRTVKKFTDLMDALIGML